MRQKREWGVQARDGASMAPADAATEAFMRYLAAELGPHGIRVCGIWTAGVADTLTQEKMGAVNQNVPDVERVKEMLAGMTALRRNVTLENVAEAAAFLASDRAAGITGSMTNVTAGAVRRCGRRASARCPSPPRAAPCSGP